MQPTKFDFVIESEDSQGARTDGATEVLAEASEVIE
jgi:hypothetical protein